MEEEVANFFLFLVAAAALTIKNDNNLKFNLNDVDYLFLKEEAEIEPFLYNMRTKYNANEIQEIKNKIQPFKN